VGGFRQLLVANVYMRDQFEALIGNEVSNACRGLPAAVCVKVLYISRINSQLVV